MEEDSVCLSSLHIAWMRAMTTAAKGAASLLACQREQWSLQHRKARQGKQHHSEHVYYPAACLANRSCLC